MATTAPAEGSSTTPVLLVDRLNKLYGAVEALKDVSLSVAPGEVVALCGENGAGKSTLARAVAGLVRPDSGRILVDGVERHLGSIIDAHAAGIRIAPQELTLAPSLSVAENISMGRLPRRALGIVDYRAMHELAQQRLGDLGIDIDVTRPVERLSVLHKTLVQVARSMTPGARLFIVDEPTAPMSGPEVDQLLGVLARLTASGIAVLYISHRMDEVFRIAERVVVLRDGRMVADFPRAQLTRGALAGAMVGGRSLEIGHRTAAATKRVALELHGLSFGFVRDLSFAVRTHEIVAVYGVSGSGREGIGMAAIGAVPVDSGTVEILGRVVRGGPRACFDAGLGYVPGERRSQGLVPEFTIRENLTLAVLRRLTRVGILDRAEERRLVQRWIGALTIAAPNAEVRVMRLSGGNQQKVLLARWLAHESKVLILEEPTRGVDIATKAEIYRVLRQLADSGVAVLVISSDLEEVALVGDRILVMRNGALVAELRGADETEIARAALAAEETPVVA
ncbi:MAG: sugar ABC transporter ATP-binding protein [Chloroflexi bacterium]|nr:sugar ABC transporter ATP-binding protein [Chloroflexota bacterium]